MNQKTFGRIIKRGTQGTISGWEGGTITPSITLRLMEERIAEWVARGQAPSRPDGFALDPRSYALGTLAAIRDDTRALASIVDALAAKVDTAERTLSGDAIPPSAVMDSSTQSGLDAVDALHGHPAPKRHKHR